MYLKSLYIVLYKDLRRWHMIQHLDVVLSRFYSGYIIIYTIYTIVKYIFYYYYIDVFYTVAMSWVGKGPT